MYFDLTFVNDLVDNTIKQEEIILIDCADVTKGRI